MLKRDNFTSIEEVRNYLIAKETPSGMFRVCKCLLKLLMIRPTSSVAFERRFSGLRRIKTWLRSTMSQERLNELLMCHIHPSILYDCSIDERMDNFNNMNDWRKGIPVNSDQVNSDQVNSDHF